LRPPGALERFFAPSGAGDFFAAEKVTKKPPKPMVLESFGDATGRFGNLAGF